MIYELFSQRKKRLTLSGAADVYQYIDVSPKLRVQTSQLLVDAIGPQYVMSPYGLGRTPPDNVEAWQLIERTLCREIGVNSVGRGSTECEQVLDYLAKADVDGFLDVCELCARYIDRVVREWPGHELQRRGITQSPSDSIDELNFRFRAEGFGFQYENGTILRIDSEYIHQEIVKPALSLLTAPGFAGPQQEFMAAHRHYRAGEYSQSIIEAAKAFESTLKVACDTNAWAYPKGARASDLLKILRQKNLWPDYMDNSFDQLLATLASGLPKVRNEEGAHGQGAEVKNPPEYISAYALHLAAAKIRLISEASVNRRG